MRRTAVLVDPRYREHDTGRTHPERPERIDVLLELFESAREDFLFVAPRLASFDELCLVHEPEHVERVAATASRAWYAFDADTPCCDRSYEVARLAVGGVLNLVDAVLRGEADCGFAAVRPPGHHAERNRAMGFCLFNNVAVAAAYLRKRGCKRILVVDWDVHHGNGTQHIFERDADVLFVSTHQYPFYPGTGSVDEVGLGEGEGFTVNLPFPAGFGDGEYFEAFRAVILPVASEFEPEFVLVSAGFDAHLHDPLGGMRVTEVGFRAMARTVVEIARATAADRVVAVLEGGYDLAALRASVAGVLEELRGSAEPLEIPPASSRACAVFDAVRRRHSDYWRSLSRG
ncbi:MAG: histone deacetylase [Candidatus Binatia bacterium]|nr:MAG: histone deacetylase [Candidatus Binatia bacterium]